MPFTVAAIGAGVSAAAGIAGGIMQKNAVDKGASQARDALNQGITTATNQLSPWTTAGQPALTDQSDLLGLNGQPAADAAMAKFQSSPGYQFQLGQGLRAVDAGAAAKGLARSGAAMQAEQQFGSGLAATDFGNYWNRLQQLSGSGLDAAKGIASAATGGAQQIAGVDTGQASMNASIYGNMAKGIGTSANQLLSNTAFQNYIGGGGGGGGAPQMTGFAPAYQPGQVGVGGFVAPMAPTQGY
jgi:hypothetical protein